MCHNFLKSACSTMVGFRYALCVMVKYNKTVVENWAPRWTFWGYQFIGLDEPQYLVFETTMDFDAIEIYSGGPKFAAILERFEVAQVCASKTALPVDPI